jgi:hypothetical protein
MTWTNIKDQTPPEGDCLIVIDSVPNRGMERSYFDGARFYGPGPQVYEVASVTHWMPLPEYPEAG